MQLFIDLVLFLTHFELKLHNFDSLIYFFKNITDVKSQITFFRKVSRFDFLLKFLLNKSYN
ncbi:hypothetical protein BpHYR1_017566 [Brachionus plicatilis]|uniref:Uncharacterized protein n=1 Tax=Brachionus plicatilis TaxID=10195 RepID=A0A3M7RX08_BRAPC|nr:hypothetical protein BpHYR1_017566 [Brachionus plicatilis]